MEGIKIFHVKNTTVLIFSHQMIALILENIKYLHDQTRVKKDNVPYIEFINIVVAIFIQYPLEMLTS